jgi:hypothetical protein
MQHGTLSQRSFVHRGTGQPWAPWPARHGLSAVADGRLIDNPTRIVVLSPRTDAAKELSPALLLIYGAAIRIEIKHLKTNDVRISNLRYSPVLESENAWSQSDSQSLRLARLGLSAAADGRPRTPGRLIYGAAIRIEIKHLKTNHVKISNLRYSPVFGLRNTNSGFEPPVTRATRYSVRRHPSPWRNPNRKCAIRTHFKHLKTKDGRQF